MPILEKEMRLDVMDWKSGTHVCGECGGNLTVAWGGNFGWNQYILRCVNDVNHNGVVRPYRPGPYDSPGNNILNLKGRDFRCHY